MTRCAWYPGKGERPPHHNPYRIYFFHLDNELSVKQINPLVYHPLTGYHGLFMLSTFLVSWTVCPFTHVAFSSLSISFFARQFD